MLLWKVTLCLTIAVLVGLQFLSGHLTILQFTQWTSPFDSMDLHGGRMADEAVILVTNDLLRMAQNDLPEETFPPAIAVASEDAPSTDPTEATLPNQFQRPEDWELFPRWNRTTGIPIRPLIDFLFAVARNQSSTIETPAIRNTFPETLYVFHPHAGVYYSHQIRKRTLPTFIMDRVKPTEKIMKLAHSILWQAKRQKRWLWPHLQRLIVKNQSFPFLAWYGDFQGCNYNNWRRPIVKGDDEHRAESRTISGQPLPSYESIPLFTTCARIDCQYAFPLPTYKTIQGSMETQVHWNRTLTEYAEKYPSRWEDKISKLVWRGSLTGDIQNYTNIRWRLCRKVHTAPPEEKELYDIGLTKIPSRHDKLDLDLSQVGGLVSALSPMASFQNYKAILDLDGNSWSSRFGSLLCYHSVVLKVDPRFVDYFHYATLIPNVHYIPVHYNLSNLYDQAAYVLDPANQAHVQQVIRSANAWCQEHMVYGTLAKDYLHIFNQYVEYLHLANDEWMERWNAVQERDIFNDKQLFNMVKIK
jgi:Glycosyl transferase family 90